MTHDKIIIGAGLYGLYSAEQCGRKGEKILVLEYDDGPFKRATYINQVRVHRGYHYPRSYSTAIKSARYFDRFNEDYGFCIMKKFEKVYATSANFSWTNAIQFKRFCKESDIRCEEVGTDRYFNEGMCDGAFLTTEYAFDPSLLRDYYINKINKYSNVEIKYNSRIKEINKKKTYYELKMESGEVFSAGFLLNATYASTNQIIKMLGYEPFKIKYELCEIIICNANDKLRDVGIQ